MEKKKRTPGNRVQSMQHGLKRVKCTSQCNTIIMIISLLVALKWCIYALGLDGSIGRDTHRPHTAYPVVKWTMMPP